MRRCETNPFKAKESASKTLATLRQRGFRETRSSAGYETNPTPPDGTIRPAALGEAERIATWFGRGGWMTSVNELSE
jgi:hypothetical protein